MEKIEKMERKLEGQVREGTITQKQFTEKINVVALLEGKRRCGRCKDIKPISDYRRDKSRKEEIATRCRSCDNELHKRHEATEKWKKRNRISLADSRKKYPEKNKARVLARACVTELVFCEMCKNTGVKLHRHHPDYSKT